MIKITLFVIVLFSFSSIAQQKIALEDMNFIETSSLMKKLHLGRDRRENRGRNDEGSQFKQCIFKQCKGVAGFNKEGIKKVRACAKKALPAIMKSLGVLAK
jgi:hypothetical protein